MVLEINVWLVFCLFLNGDFFQDVDMFYQLVQVKWLYEVLDVGVESVLMFSGLFVDKKDNVSDLGNELEDMMLEKF